MKSRIFIRLRDFGRERLKSLKLTQSTQSGTSRTMDFPTSTPAAAAASFSVQKIAIIGAGPSGLAAAKYFIAQDGAFSRIDVLEQQAEVGGVWNYTGVSRPEGELGVPQVDAKPRRPDPPVYSENGGGKGVPLFPSPMYEDLNTNIPHTLMRFSDLGFPDRCTIFPPREDVQEYLVEYARDVRHLVRFSTQVTDISLRSDEGRDQWDVSTTDLLTGGEKKETYDAVVVASGHYSTPYIPDYIEGISTFHAAHPGVISHSKIYRTAEPYRGKKVVVVGTGPSGLDIAAQIQRVSSPPLLVSARTEANPELFEHLGANVRQVGQIKRFLIGERGVEFYPLHKSSDEKKAGENDSNEIKKEETIIEKDIDAILFCTGYLYTFPFLTNPPDSKPLITDGRRVHGLAKHFLHIAHPTIAFPALPIKVIPFPLAEAQASFLARLWSNVLPLPPRSELEEWERKDGEGTAPGKFHVFAKGDDGRYINELHDIIVARSKGGGKKPPYWDEEMLWQRGIYVEGKIRFERTGRKAKTLEELGFRYEPKEVKKEDGLEGKDSERDVAG
ncbi:FAD/NAD(P)-binding domain-containing protein [Hypoxylon trugodes]|uniref:FAD/NAD(P)-binding domain-containing protein n=1 Tax=Hypoxylon trugodes TaxID=326681 RepID=UPI0021978609|nr:FAD/NAD(P)-binding domain-containing protein [Hypoxylon trugodes]KAI1391466.1 FAD/NAD(P)-binding domain-containing protein [Hypoxylon trugodes]